MGSEHSKSPLLSYLCILSLIPSKYTKPRTHCTLWTKFPEPQRIIGHSLQISTQKPEPHKRIPPLLVFIMCKQHLAMLGFLMNIENKYHSRDLTTPPQNAWAYSRCCTHHKWALSHTYSSHTSSFKMMKNKRKVLQIFENHGSKASKYPTLYPPTLGSEKWEPPKRLDKAPEFLFSLVLRTMG